MAGTDAADERPLTENEEVLRVFLHDIRNPISAILGFTHLLESRHDDLSEEQRQSVVESLNRTAQRLSSIVDQFSSDLGSTIDKS